MYMFSLQNNNFIVKCRSRVVRIQVSASVLTCMFRPSILRLQCKEIIKIRDALSPHTLLDVDEAGVILPGDNNPDSPMFPLIYYNAAGAMYAYLFGRLSEIGETQHSTCGRTDLLT